MTSPTSGPYTLPRCTRRARRSRLPPFISRVRLLRCIPVTDSISESRLPRASRSAPAVFDSLQWPTLITGNGPPAITNLATLSVRGRHARGADAKEKSERGAVRGDQAGIRVWGGHDRRGGPQAGGSPEDGQGGVRERGAGGEGSGKPPPPPSGASDRVHRRDPGGGEGGAAELAAHDPPDPRAHRRGVSGVRS